MTTEKPKTTSPTAAEGLGIIEKASEIRWVLQFACAVFFADLAMLWKTGHGIVEWTTSTDQLLNNTGTLAVSLLAFGVLVAIILPLLGELSRLLLVLTVIYGTPKWLHQEPDYTRKVGYVRPYELHELALQENSQFLHGMYQEHCEKREKERVARLETGSLIIAALLMVIADWCSLWLGLSGMSVIEGLRSQLTGQQELLVLLFVACLSFFSLKWAWFSGWGEDWIYYPPLYEKIVAKVRAG